MRATVRRAIGLAFAWSAIAAPVLAQSPRIVNAKLTPRSAASGLQREVSALVSAQTSPAWIAYAVPIVDGERSMCCGMYSDGQRMCCNACGLEGSRSDNVNVGAGAVIPGDGRVKLEGPSTLVVLLRVESRAIGKIRTYSEDCELDAGGLPVFWLTDVKPPESVALLLEQVSDAAVASTRVTDSAVTAVALHKDPSADRALDQLLDPKRPDEVRRKVTFWLGNARGAAGLERLKRVLRDDPSDKVREQATFGLSVSKEPDALPTLIAAARNDRSTRVRGQALFWLAQKAGRTAAATLTSAIDNDPETDVKKKAVFALSQLPKDEGVPLLIQVARTNKNPEVRKQAIFWLGQSHDPRALTFFEEVLRPR